MATKLLATTWRLPCNQASSSNTGSLPGTGATLGCWKASTLLVQGALFIGDPTQAGNLVTDLSNIVSVVLAMRVGGPTGALLFNELVIPVANLNVALVYADWIGGTDQHFTFTVTTAMLNVAAQKSVWLVVGVNTVDGSAFPVATNNAVTINDPGINNPSDANSTTTYTGWSKAEADARYVLLSAGVGDFAPAITSVGTGAAGSLETLATVGLATPVLRTLFLGGALQDWLLVPGTDPDDSTHQRPNDYNAATNAVVWVRLR